MAGEACLSLPFPAHRDHTRLDVEKSRIPPFHTLHLHPSSTASHNISVLHAVILPSLPPARSPVLSPSTLPGLITFFSRNSKKKKQMGHFIYLYSSFLDAPCICGKNKLCTTSHIHSLVVEEMRTARKRDRVLCPRSLSSPSFVTTSFLFGFGHCTQYSLSVTQVVFVS